MATQLTQRSSITVELADAQVDQQVLDRLFREGPLSTGQISARLLLTIEAAELALNRLREANWIRLRRTPGSDPDDRDVWEIRSLWPW